MDLNEMGKRPLNKHVNSDLFYFDIALCIFEIQNVLNDF